MHEVHKPQHEKWLETIADIFGFIADKINTTRLQFALPGNTAIQQTCEAYSKSSLGHQCYFTVVKVIMLFLSKGSPVSNVVVQCEHWGPRMYGTIVGHGSDDHHSRCYRIQVTKMGHIITRNKRHIKSIPIITE